MKKELPKKFYRFSNLPAWAGNDIIYKEEFDLVRETPGGYWIEPSSTTSLLNSILENNTRWIPKKSKKRFAYPTELEAIESFVARKRQQLRILYGQLNVTKDALDVGNKLEMKIRYQDGN